MIIWNSGVIIFLFFNNYISKGSDFLNVIIKHGNIKENIRIKASFPFILHFMLFSIFSHFYSQNEDFLTALQAKS